MEQNKIRTYLLYAIGEILLVMVGILLALQVNNWNEDRKLQFEELSLLQEIRENLVESKKDIDQMVTVNQELVDGYMLLLSHIESGKSEDDSLYPHFGGIGIWASPYLTFTAYETLKQKGIDLLKNKELRKNITHLYESRFASLVNDWDRAEWVYHETVVIPYFSENFEMNLTSDLRSDESIGRYAIPNDYNALLEGTQFRNIVTRLIAIRSAGNRRGQSISGSISDLIIEIDKELQQRGHSSLSD